MKKSILNIGKTLNAVDQKQINGGAKQFPTCAQTCANAPHGTPCGPPHCPGMCLGNGNWVNY